MEIDRQKLSEIAGNRGSATEGFLGVLFAVIALGVMLWVGLRLMTPYPSNSTPEQALDAAKNKASISAAKEKPVALDNAANLPIDIAGNEEDPVCGMNPYRSAMRVEAEFSDGTKLAFDSVACYLQYVDEQAAEGVEPSRERVVSYDTWQSEAPKLLDFADAIWIIELDGNVPGAMPPGLAAFGSEEDAEGFMGDLGGRLATLDEMRGYVRDYLED